jgi:hypothetical protein
VPGPEQTAQLLLVLAQVPLVLAQVLLLVVAQVPAQVPRCPRPSRPSELSIVGQPAACILPVYLKDE